LLLDWLLPELLCCYWRDGRLLELLSSCWDELLWSYLWLSELLSTGRLSKLLWCRLSQDWLPELLRNCLRVEARHSSLWERRLLLLLGQHLLLGVEDKLLGCCWLPNLLLGCCGREGLERLSPSKCEHACCGEECLHSARRCS